MVHDTDIVELELKSKKFSLSMKKKEALEKPEPIYQMVSLQSDSMPLTGLPTQGAGLESKRPASLLMNDSYSAKRAGRYGGR